ncbi:hypothetical protein B0H13DRAFT_2681304 [Mycena leptocephala]|nr:hypothetical protein B0H13DRAFT_2681304 [Mycena leptocephala]
MMHRSHMPLDSPYSLYDLPSSSSHSSSSYSSRSSASRSHAPRISATSTSRSSGSSSRWTSSPSTSSVTPSQSISQASYRVSSSTHFPPSRSHPPHSPTTVALITYPIATATRTARRHTSSRRPRRPPPIHAEGTRHDHPPGPGWGAAGRVLLNPVAVVGSRAFVRRGRRGTRACGHCGSAARCWSCLDFYLLDFPYTHSRIYRSTQPSTDESLRTVCCYDTHTHGIKCNRGTNYISNAARIRRCGCTKQTRWR